MKLRNIVIFGLLALLTMNCGKQPENDTLLRIDGNYYSILDFFDTYSRERFIKVPEESKISQIENWAENQLLIDAAEDINYFEKNKELKKELDKFMAQANVRYYLDRTILDSIVTKEKMIDFYNRMGTEINANHVLIQWNETNDAVDRTKDEARKLAEEISEKAKSGEEFSALVQQYSDDKNSGKHGNLGYFGVGRMVPPFEQAAFSMEKNEISDPVESRFGFHVIKVVDIRKNSVKSFEKEKENIKNKLIAKHRDELQNTYRERIDKLKKEYDFKLDDEAVNTLIENANKKRESIGKQSLYSEIKILESLDGPQSIGTFEGDPLTIEKIIEKIENTHFRLPPQYLNERYFENVVEQLFVTEMLLDKFKKSDIELTEEYKQNIESSKRNLTVKEYRKELMNQDIEVTEAEIKKYYEDNKEKRYMTAPRAEVREIYLEDREEAEKLLKEILDNKDKFDIYSEKLTQRFREKEKPGYLGKITAAQYGDIGRIAVKTPENTIHPDLIDAGKGVTIIKVYDKMEAKPKAFSDVKRSIESIIRSNKRKENENKALDDLKKKYNYKIYWDVVNIEK